MSGALVSSYHISRLCAVLENDSALSHTNMKNINVTN